MDGVSLQGFTNQEVLEVMKQTGQTVHLTLARKMASPRPSLERSLDKGKDFLSVTCVCITNVSLPLLQHCTVNPLTS